MPMQRLQQSTRHPKTRVPVANNDASSASTYRCAKNVSIHAVIIAELKLGNIQRHVFGADLVERADHASFEDRPKAFNRVRVNRADDVLMPSVVNCLVMPRWHNIPPCRSMKLSSVVVQFDCGIIAEKVRKR